MRKYVRVEKVSNGYILQVGGPGSSQMTRQWIAENLNEVTDLLETILNEEIEP